VGKTTPLHSGNSYPDAFDGAEGGSVASAVNADPDREERAASESAAIADVSQWGYFTLGGKDGPKFVQGLTTNDILGLAPGTGCYSAFLNVHGRFETDCTFFRFADEYVLVTPPEGATWLETSLNRFLRAGDFKFKRLDPATSAFTVQGPRAIEVLRRALGTDISDFPDFGAREVNVGDGVVRVLGTRRSAYRGADVVGEASIVASLWRAIGKHDVGAAVPVGSDVLDRLRLAAGIPRFAMDFDNDTVLQEIDVPDIVSFTKGCYLGQEIVARLHYLGKPSKLLRRLVFEGDSIPAPGATLFAEIDGQEREAGIVRSATRSATSGTLVLAMIKRKYNEPGTTLFVRRGDDRLAASVAPNRAVRVPSEGGA
jgi:folate-binding protein YgfZ